MLRLHYIFLSCLIFRVLNIFPLIILCITMPGPEKVTRSMAEEESKIQKIIEKVFSSDTFLTKIIEAVSIKMNEYLDKQLSAFEDKIVKLENDVISIQDKLEISEQYSRLNSIRIYGVPERPQENVTEDIISMIKSKLKVDVVPEDICICHRLKSKEGGIKPVIVKFVRRSKKNEVYKEKKHLKGTKIIIREDLTQCRASMVRELIKTFTNKNVFTSNGNIYIRMNNDIHKISSRSDYRKFKHNK